MMSTVGGVTLCKNRFQSNLCHSNPIYVILIQSNPRAVKMNKNSIHVLSKCNPIHPQQIDSMCWQNEGMQTEYIETHDLDRIHCQTVKGCNPKLTICTFLPLKCVASEQEHTTHSFAVLFMITYAGHWQNSTWGSWMAILQKLELLLQMEAALLGVSLKLHSACLRTAVDRGGFVCRGRVERWQGAMCRVYYGPNCVTHCLCVINMRCNI